MVCLVGAGSVALRGTIVEFGHRRDAQMTRPIVRDPIYRRRRFDAEIIELCVRWYITYRLELSGSGGDDGRARHCRIAHDDSSLGDSLCAGVRKAMEPLRSTREYFLARG